MKTAPLSLLFAAWLMVIPSLAVAQSPPLVEEEIGIVRLKNGAACLDKPVRRALDALVPRMSALQPGRIVKIEAGAAWGSGREERIRNSFLLALEAQRYLRARLRSGQNLFIAVASGLEPGENAFIRVVTFPDSFAAVHVSQKGERQ